MIRLRIGRKVRGMCFAALLAACLPVRAADTVSLMFDSVSVADLARVTYGELARDPYVLTHEALQVQEAVSLRMFGIERDKAIAQVGNILEASGFEVRRRAGVVWIDRKKPVEEEVIVYRPVHRSSRYLSDVVQSVTGARSLSARTVRNQEAVQPVQQSIHPQPVVVGNNSQVMSRPPESMSSAAGMIDRAEVDQVAFSVSSKEAGKVRKLLSDLDTPASEIVLKAAVYEVGTDRKEGGAVKLAASLLGGRFGVDITGNVLDGVSVKLSVGGIDAVLSALDADSRFKSISRPRVRVRNGAQARFSVGSDVPVLGNAQIDRNGNPVQSVDYRQSGIILTATPEIRAEVIELNLSQELSSFVATNTGVNNSPTLIKRAVNTRLSLQPGEVVVLAGLEDDRHEERDDRLPFLGWLIGNQHQNRQSEILVLIEAQRI